MNILDIFNSLSSIEENEREQYINEILDEYFNSIDDEELRRKIKGKHWKIQTELRHYKDPIAKHNKMVELFWEGVSEFKGIINKK